MATINHLPPSVLASGLYARLGLSRGASAADIKREYRSLVMRFHPDGSLVAFLALQAAYESLLARPRSAMQGGRRASSDARAGSETGWAGARWYWDGVRANAARRAGREQPDRTDTLAGEH